MIDRSLHDHLTIHGFKITRREKDNGNDFNALSWDVLGQKGQGPFKPGLVLEDGFTVEFLSKQAILLRIDPDQPKVPCLLLGMRPALSLYLLFAHPHV